MKNKVSIIIGLTALCLLASGCGSKSVTEDTAPVTTVKQSAETEQPDAELVHMEKEDNQDTPETAAEESLKVIGVSSESAVKLTFTNQTGDEITYLFIRNNDYEDWGDERIGGTLTLTDGEKSTLYFEKDEEAALYDIRVGYADEDKSECFFRKLPLDTITEISLCMDGEGDEAIPYARYKTAESKREVSTLLDVKVRLGMLTEEEAQAIAAEKEAQAQAEAGSAEEEKPKEASKADAESCIGKQLKALTDLCGQPRKTTYKREPETGMTGYHEYKNFTVSTTVEEDGNEIVAGVW